MKELSGSVLLVGEPAVRVAAATEVQWFDEKMGALHYLGAGKSVGDYLRQVVQIGGQPVALLVWGPACYSLKDRDRWIGWSANQRIERLKLVAQNRRFLLLTEKGQAPNLASQALASALRALPDQWRQQFGYRPLLAESFTDPEAYCGTCYKASNWEPVGHSAGYSRHRVDFYVFNDRPKRLWMRELRSNARQHLRAVDLPADCQSAVIAPPSGVLPVKQQEMDSLLQFFCKAPDPRDRNTRFRTGAVLTLIAMALLAGRREIAAIARFATSLTQAQRRRLNLPLKKGTRRFYQVPSYSVFYQVLTRMDPEAFAQMLSDWLFTRNGTLPQALALDGKMIRDHIGLLTLAEHEDGAPQALAVYDQKEGTERCELRAADALLKSIPSLDGKIITADPLHCQRQHARVIVEKGGDYLLQIKANQPKLHKKAQGLDARPSAPLFADTHGAHGRVETRRLHAFAIEPLEADFPFARSLVIMRTERTVKKTGQTTGESHYYLSSVCAEGYSPVQWLNLIRGHWGGVEIRNHWRRDALMGEDRSRSRNAHLLANVALIRSFLLAQLAEKIPDKPLPIAIEEFAAKPATTLAFFNL